MAYTWFREKLQVANGRISFNKTRQCWTGSIYVDIRCWDERNNVRIAIHDLVSLQYNMHIRHAVICIAHMTDSINLSGELSLLRIAGSKQQRQRSKSHLQQAVSQI